MTQPYLDDNEFNDEIVYLEIDAAEAAVRHLQPFADDPRIAAVIAALGKEVIYLDFGPYGRDVQ